MITFTQEKGKILITLTLTALLWFIFSLHAQASIDLKLPYRKEESWLLTQGYGMGTHRNLDKFALDFAQNGYDAFDRPILAAASGQVLKAKSGGWNGGYGSYVLIAHQNGLKSQYAHLNLVSVEENQKIEQEKEIGKCGNTGYCLGKTCEKHPGTHLHLAMYKDGRAYKPEPMSGYTNFTAGKWYTSDNELKRISQNIPSFSHNLQTA